MTPSVTRLGHASLTKTQQLHHDTVKGGPK